MKKILIIFFLIAATGLRAQSVIDFYNYTDKALNKNLVNHFLDLKIETSLYFDYFLSPSNSYMFAGTQSFFFSFFYQTYDSSIYGYRFNYVTTTGLLFNIKFFGLGISLKNLSVPSDHKEILESYLSTYKNFTLSKEIREYAGFHAQIIDLIIIPLEIKNEVVKLTSLINISGLAVKNLDFEFLYNLKELCKTYFNLYQGLVYSYSRITNVFSMFSYNHSLGLKTIFEGKNLENLDITFIYNGSFNNLLNLSNYSINFKYNKDLIPEYFYIETDMSFNLVNKIGGYIRIGSEKKEKGNPSIGFAFDFSYNDYWRYPILSAKNNLLFSAFMSISFNNK